MGGYQGRVCYAKWGRTHEGSYREKERGCFSCSQDGHFSWDFPQDSISMFFHYNQVGHNKVDCPRLIGGVVTVRALATLRITDGHEGRAESPLVRNWAFQLQTNETRVPPHAIVGMFHFYFLHALLYSFFLSCDYLCEKLYLV